MYEQLVEYVAMIIVVGGVEQAVCCANVLTTGNMQIRANWAGQSLGVNHSWCNHRAYCHGEMPGAMPFLRASGIDAPLVAWGNSSK